MTAVETPRVLVVDDRRDNLLTVEAVLRDLPIEIHSVESGEGALKRLLTEDYAVILLDAHMPGMDGFETAALIKQRERSRRVPIVFLTAGDEPRLALRSYELGAVDYLTKPLQPGALRSKVTVFAELWSAHAELRTLNAQLQARTEELDRSNRDLEQFAYVASHDLQEPLRKITGFCGLLRSRYHGKLDDRADQYLDFAIDGATRMSRLITELLAFSRVGRATSAHGNLDSQKLLDAALRNIGTQIDEAGAKVTYDPLPTVLGEPSLLTTVFQNLISNAVKFRSQRPPEIHVGVARVDGLWRFRVRDNGIGVDPEYAEKVFGIFQRLHGSDRYPGTGLGLALCRKIIEHHGGTIWLDIDGGEGTGSAFCFTLPVVDGPHR